MNASPGVATFFDLMRHAPTVWNAQRRIQGQADAPLTPAGEALARGWGLVLKGQPYSRILSSDLGRALATAAALTSALGLPLTVDPRLREQDWGRWTGETLAALRARDPVRLAAAEARGWDFRPPGGESRREVWRRGRAALMAAARRWPGEPLLVVTHEGMLKCLAYGLSARRFLPDEAPLLRPRHLHRLCAAGGDLTPTALNRLALDPGPHP
jgi:probable phosphoglycerate mutase